jgi:ubiquinone biosynthesis protein COQ4
MATSPIPAFPAQPRLEIPPAPPRRPVEWRAARRALRELVADPTRTSLVFELLGALGGPDGEPWFQRFVRHPDGRRILVSRRDLAEALGDRAALARLPAGSLGRAYLAHLDRWGLDPTGVVAAQRRAAAARGVVDDDPTRRWFFDRVTLMHDVWHVLTGYGADEMGEAALLAFTEAQMHSRGMLLLVATAALLGPTRGAFAWQRYLARAFARGRRAVALQRVAFEELLPRPLGDVRRALRIAPPEIAHPGGVWEGPVFTLRRRGEVAA